MHRMRQQLFAGAGLAQQEHGRGRLRRAPCLALDLGGRRAGTDETGEGVFGAAIPRARTAQLLAALRQAYAAGIASGPGRVVTADDLLRDCQARRG